MKKQAPKHNKVILGILTLTLGVLLILSIFSFETTDFNHDSGFSDNIQNMMGQGGAFVSYFLITYTFGYASAAGCALLIIIGLQFIRQKPYSWFKRIAVYSTATMFLTSYGLGIINEFSIGGGQPGFKFSGILGGFFASYSHLFFGKAGTYILFFAFALILTILWSQLKFWQVLEIIEKFLKKIWSYRKKFVKIVVDYKRKKDRIRKIDETYKNEQEKELRAKLRSGKNPDIEVKNPGISQDIETSSMTVTGKNGDDNNPLDKYYISKKPDDLRDEQTKIVINKPLTPEETDINDESDFYEPGVYNLPPLSLLNDSDDKSLEPSEDEIKRHAEILEGTLLDFGVSAKVVEVHPGPVLTLYEVRPDTGVKIARILSLQDDIALAMKARGIRIIAPIPGKDTVGVEIPNNEAQVIYLKSILATQEFANSKSKLTLPLGRTTTGEVYIADLATMPHLLICGQTGAGKSVGLNNIITSILFNATPQEVQFVLIDPKMVELSLFRKLEKHHLLSADFLEEKVITKSQNAVLILKSLVTEMEKRYEIMAHFGVRNILDYNSKPNKEPNPDTGQEYPEKFDFIVVIIDEFADLMMVAAKEVEEPIARLAQMARAVGIHLILATQRPSVDVLTGFIKSNFPARIAYSVFSKTDSRTILDMNGAETLLGKGDMLYLPPGSPKPIRIQNPLITVEELEKVVDYVSKQAKFPKITKLIQEAPFMSGGGGSFGVEGRDSLFTDAAKIIVTHQQGSISLLQRRLKIGYSRAARLIDEMEEAGIVGPYDGSKARLVLVEEEDLGDFL